MILGAGRRLLAAKADQALAAHALRDHFLDALEGAAAHKKHVGGIEGDVLLLRVLAAGQRRHVRHAALKDLQQRLLHTLAGDIARDRGVVGLASDLVDLVDVDDARLGALHVAVGGLDEAQENILHVLAHVTGLGERRSVRDREGHIQYARKRLGEQRLAAAGGTEQQDVALADLHIVDLRAGPDALIVVVDGHREHHLGPLLAHYILVELLAQLARRGQPGRASGRVAPRRRHLLLGLLGDNGTTKRHTLVADKHRARAGDQTLHLVLATAAERADIGAATTSIAGTGHGDVSRGGYRL